MSLCRIRERICRYSTARRDITAACIRRTCKSRLNEKIRREKATRIVPNDLFSNSYGVERENTQLLRSIALLTLTDFIPLFSEVGAPRTLAKICRAIRDVGEWWW